MLELSERITWHSVNTYGLPQDIGQGYSADVLVWIDYRSQGGTAFVEMNRYVYHEQTWERQGGDAITHWATMPMGPYSGVGELRRVPAEAKAVSDG